MCIGHWPVTRPDPAQNVDPATRWPVTRTTRFHLCAKVLPSSDQVGFYLASTHQMAPQSTHPIKRVCYSFIDLGRMKGWVGLFGWSVVDGLPTQWSPVGCRPSAGQSQFAGQRPAFRQLCYGYTGKEVRFSVCALRSELNRVSWQPVCRCLRVRDLLSLL